MRRYGSWACNKNGTPEDPKRCVVEVQAGNGYLFHQCRRSRGFGPNGDRCKQHNSERFDSAVPKEK